MESSVAWCRWSSDNSQCDLYIYDDVAGHVTVHVAASRFAKPWRKYQWDPETRTFPFWDEPMPEERCDLDMEHAGETFHFPYDDESLLEFLSECERIGYLAPYDYLRECFEDSRKEFGEEGN